MMPLGIAFFGKAGRGIACLKLLVAKNIRISLVAISPNDTNGEDYRVLAGRAGAQFRLISDPNEAEELIFLESLNVDVFILAGYPVIVRSEFLSLGTFGVINLHAGALPNYRGSSPLNWAIINGENEIGVSIIKVDLGIDSGPILAEKKLSFPGNLTIKDAHKLVNQTFPKMLLEVLENIEKDSVILKEQSDDDACYYPLRFPRDGLVLWDMLDATQIYNWIRALTKPYPCAYTYFGNRKIFLISAKQVNKRFQGVPGRIYVLNSNGILIAAKKNSIWIDEAETESREPLQNIVKRYSDLATLSGTAEHFYQNWSDS
jgi:methionyl-tRNA formyltransferase